MQSIATKKTHIESVVWRALKKKNNLGDAVRDKK